MDIITKLEKRYTRNQLYNYCKSKKCHRIFKSEKK